MPFPFAHPAAVLPFRPWCLKYLDFVALVVGSLVPDLAACIDDWEYFSHTIVGAFVFCMPVGLVTIWIFYSVRTPLVFTLPNPHRDALGPLCANIPKSNGCRIISLLLGSGIHIAWDQFTHDHSWLVQHTVLSSVRLAGVRMNHVVWLLSSLGGSMIVIAAYVSLLQRRSTLWWCVEPAERSAYTRWLCIGLVPLVGAIPLTLHDAREGLGIVSVARPLAMYYLGCAYLTLAVTGFACKFGILGGG